MPKTEKNEIQFRETILNQIQDYLNKKITKEEYYEQSEAFYTEYAFTYENAEFHKYFLHTVPDICLIYIDEPGLAPEIKEEKFHEALQEAYIELQKL